MARIRWIERLGQLPGWPLLLEAEAAAAYVSLKPCEFARAVQFGELPAPRKLAGRPLWSRRDLEARFDQGGSPRSPDFDPIAAAIAAT